MSVQIVGVFVGGQNWKFTVVFESVRKHKNNWKIYVKQFNFFGVSNSTINNLDTIFTKYLYLLYVVDYKWFIY